MVDTAVMELTNKPSVGKAWESLFPAGHPNMNTRIGIKLNFSYGDWKNDIENDWSKMFCPFGTKAAVSNAIISGLTQMLDGTFPIENITLIERMYSVGARQFYPLIQGYRPVLRDDDGLFKDSRPGACNMHWVYAANPLELPADAPSFVAAPDYPVEYRAPQRIYAAVYQNDFLINYSVAKDHREAGITGAMKNNYGCTNNPVGTHGDVWKRHDSPYPGTRLCVPAFYENVNKYSLYILNILDALTVVYNGGPLSGNVFNANAIAVSKDPVALDSYSLNMINGIRRDKGLSLIGTDNGWTSDNHPNASFLPVASEAHQLGSMSQDDLQHFDLSDHNEVYIPPVLQKSHSRVGEVKINRDTYSMNLYLDKSKRDHTIESRIEDIRGKSVRSFPTRKTNSSQVTLEWDNRNDKGSTAGEGVYTWYVTVDGILHTGTINGFLYSRKN